MGRERVTISIQDTLVKRLDAMIDKKKIRNRSHAVEMLLNQIIQASEIVLAVVMLGGEHAVDNQPFAYEAMQSLTDQIGLKNFIIIVGFQGREIEDKFRDKSNKDWQLVYHQTDVGSGGGLKEVAGDLPHQFAIINMAAPLEFNWHAVTLYQQKYNPTATLWTDGESLSGVGLYQKRIIESIVDEFNILEEEPLHDLIKQGELIVLPEILYSQKQPIINLK